MSRFRWLCLFVVWSLTGSAMAAEIKLLQKTHDPYGTPRPAPKQQHVPLGTTVYFELATVGAPADDEVIADSIAVQLEPAGGSPVPLLLPKQKFGPGYLGKIFGSSDREHSRKTAVYIDSEQRLQPSTTYTIRVAARSQSGLELSAKSGTWEFTTEPPPRVVPLDYRLSVNAPSVSWQGGFFTGYCIPSFCFSEAHRIPTFELMNQVRESSPRAWSLRRDFWMTGMDYQPELFSPKLPNIVRERETRRITAIEEHGDEAWLRIEDFFGHEQYGIESNRPLGGDYRVGDEILVADGRNSSRAKVLGVDEALKSVRVSKVATPDGGWKLAYSAPLPKDSDPQAPGLFPPGGTYLRKFSPAGTPAYFWGRLDHEWDLAHRKFGQRLSVNFADAPGDLSIDGRNWTTAKDYAELHEVVRTITGHLIERYGDETLTFSWSVFNEPDLGVLFWRTSWDDLQTFYDYTVDGILRAFEDHGYDSDRVFIGGLELAGIFGTNLKLKEFLTHCAPHGTAPGALLKNAAYADARLEGKRSKRVETLCSQHGGRGTPCDFVSVHAYNRSRMMADKLAAAKQMALEIDPEYYAKLWVNSHESCPEWAAPPDPAYGDSYLGNGYFESWCTDVVRRQLQRAAADPRFAFGETILTFWPWANTNFGGGNDCARQIHVDENGDGQADRSVTVAMPILNLLGLIAGMGNELQVLPEQVVGGHVVSGFAAARDGTVQVLVYSHNGLDTESRSGVEFDVTLAVQGMKSAAFAVQEHRFDSDHNSYFRLGRALRIQDEALHGAMDPADSSTTETLGKAVRALESGERAQQLAGLDQLASLGSRGASAAGAIYQFVAETRDDAVRSKAQETLKRISSPRGYPADVVRQVEEAAQLRPQAMIEQRPATDGALRLTTRLAGNAVNLLKITPAKRD